MSRTRIAIVTTSVAVLGLFVGLRASEPAADRGDSNPPPERFARYVDHGFIQPGLNDVDPLLHVQRYQGRVELNSGFRNCKLVLAAYKDGKPVTLPDAEADLMADAETSCTLRYGMQVADLDYLPLGDAKKHHCRLRFMLQHPDGATSALERDIPKDLLDLSHCSNMAFNERAATHREVPLCWFKVGGTMPGPTVPGKQLVETKWTKDGAVLIASLRFNERADSQDRK